MKIACDRALNKMLAMQKQDCNSVHAEFEGLIWAVREFLYPGADDDR